MDPRSLAELASMVRPSTMTSVDGSTVSSAVISIGPPRFKPL